MKRDIQSMLPPVKNAGELLDLFYLDMRSAILETAAAFDRLQRAENQDAVMRDRRVERLRAACRIASGDAPDRAERILNLFSEDAP